MANPTYRRRHFFQTLYSELKFSKAFLAIESLEKLNEHQILVKPFDGYAMEISVHVHRKLPILPRRVLLRNVLEQAIVVVETFNKQGDPRHLATEIGRLEKLIKERKRKKC